MRSVFSLLLCLLALSLAAQQFQPTSHLVASDRQINDKFGSAVDISGSRAIMGAPDQQENSMGTQSFYAAGGAYIFERDSSGNWLEVQILTPVDRNINDYFGAAVTIDGDYAAGGAASEDHDVTGGNLMHNAGSAYIFARDSAGVWTQVQKIVASDRESSGNFGASISMHGDYLVVGATGEDKDASGGNPLPAAGAVYVFRRDSSNTWQEIQKLVAADRNTGAIFGSSVDISGTTIVVGSQYDEFDATGGNALTSPDSAYFFDLDSTGVWTQTAKVDAFDRDNSDLLGWSSAIAGDYAVVGALAEDEDELGLNTLNAAGSAYIYERDSAGSWAFAQKIVAPDRAIADGFGISVAIDYPYIVVGALRQDTDSLGANSLTDAGAAYVYKHDGAGTWNFLQKLSGFYRGNSDRLGRSVSISLPYVLAGAEYDGTGANGIVEVGHAGTAQLFQLCTTVTDTFSVTACGSYTVPSGDETYTLLGSYTVQDTVSNAGCGNSLLTIHVTIPPPLTGQVTQTICHSDSVVVNGTVYNAANPSGTEVFTNIGPNGCDSTVTVNLTVLPALDSVLNATICHSDSVVVNGTVYNAANPSGTEVFTNIGPNGCDSTVTVALTVLQPAVDTIQQLCHNDTVWVNGTAYHAGNLSGVEVLASAAANGCDSTVVIDLMLLPLASDTLHVALCPNDSVVVNGITYNGSNASGVQLFPNASANGCDSTLVVQLSFWGPVFDSLSVTVCDAFTVPSGSATYTSSATVFDTVAMPSGCDTIRVIALTVLQSSADTISITECESYTLPSGSATVSSSGLYVDTLSNALGCDSLLTLDVTILQPTTDTLSVSACNSYTLPSGSQTVVLGGTYVDTLVNAAGCDSLLAINLTIDSAFTTNDTVMACQGETVLLPGGTTVPTISSDTVHTYVTSTAAGCDSTVITNIFVFPNYVLLYDTVLACIGDTVVFPDGTASPPITGAIQHASNLSTANGCDSTILTEVIALPTQQSTVTDTICAGANYTFPDGTVWSGIDTSTAYTSVLQAANGCDSSVTTQLYVADFSTNITQVGPQLVAASEGVMYQWYLCGTNLLPLQGETDASFQPPANGLYAVQLSYGGCVDTSACISVTNVGMEQLRSMVAAQLIPNPTRNTVTIELSQPLQAATAAVLDLHGRVVVAPQPLNGTRTQLPLGELAAGLYVVQLRSPEALVLLRLIIH